MRNAVGEFVLSILVIIGCVAIAEVVRFLVFNESDFIIGKFMLLTNQTTTTSSNNSTVSSVNISFSDNYKDATLLSDNVVNKLNDKVTVREDSYVSSNDSSKLDKLINKDIKKYNKNKISCSNNCNMDSSISDISDVQKYKVGNNYIVNFSDNENEVEYSFNYETKKGLFRNKYVLIGVNAYNKKDNVEKSNSIKEKEENKDFTVDYSYDESYVSMANANISKSFSDDNSLVDKIYKENVEAIVTLNPEFCSCLII